MRVVRQPFSPVGTKNQEIESRENFVTGNQCRHDVDPELSESSQPCETTSDEERGRDEKNRGRKRDRSSLRSCDGAYAYATNPPGRHNLCNISMLISSHRQCLISSAKKLIVLI